MNAGKIPFIILIVVALIAIIGLVLVLKAQKQGAVQYHQILHREYAVFVDYRACDGAPCGRAAIQIGEENIGDAIQTTNAVCQCPDGKIYRIDTRRRY